MSSPSFDMSALDSLVSCKHTTSAKTARPDIKPCQGKVPAANIRTCFQVRQQTFQASESPVQDCSKPVHVPSYDLHTFLVCALQDDTTVLGFVQRCSMRLDQVHILAHASQTVCIVRVGIFPITNQMVRCTGIILCAGRAQGHDAARP